MKDVETSFNQLGIDAVTGVEIMDWLGLSKIDLDDPMRFSRLRDVIDHFKQFPTDTQRFLIRRVVTGKNVDKLQHIWEYAGLMKNRDREKQALEKIKAEASALGDNADITKQIELTQKEQSVSEGLSRIEQEISIYEH